MEFGTSVGIFIICMGICFILPIFAFVLISFMVTDKKMRPFAYAVLLSGVTLGIMLLLFRVGIVWDELQSNPEQNRPRISHVAWQNIEYAYVGFGIGSITATILGIPGSIIINRFSSWRNARHIE